MAPKSSAVGCRGSPIRGAADVTIQDLGNIGELIAAVATVLTLFYLAVQIRASTRVARLEALHSTTAATPSHSVAIAQDRIAAVAPKAGGETADDAGAAETAAGSGSQGTVA
jgi:hypothetical protein